MPLHRRLPKRGFVSLTAALNAEVRLSELDRLPVDEIDLLVLKQAGMVAGSALSAKVILSGKLARPVHLISLGEIIRVIEGPLALVPCVSRTAYRPCKDCRDEATCAIRHAMARVRDETARILDGTSLADTLAEDLAAA